MFTLRKAVIIIIVPLREGNAENRLGEPAFKKEKNK